MKVEKGRVNGGEDAWTGKERRVWGGIGEEGRREKKGKGGDDNANAVNDRQREREKQQLVR